MWCILLVSQRTHTHTPLARWTAAAGATPPARPAGPLCAPVGPRSPAAAPPLLSPEQAPAHGSCTAGSTWCLVFFSAERLIHAPIKKIGVSVSASKLHRRPTFMLERRGSSTGCHSQEVACYLIAAVHPLGSRPSVSVLTSRILRSIGKLDCGAH